MRPDQSTSPPAGPRVALIGLGPHARRIYLHFIAASCQFPVLIVELESQRPMTEAYLRGRGEHAETLFIADEHRDRAELPARFRDELSAAIRRLAVTHAIISTEPKAHFAYLKFFLSHQVSVLTDKPITALARVSTDPAMALQIEEQYRVLDALYTDARRRGEISCQVQCQRRWHAGYRYVRSVVGDCVHRYHIPITSIDIYHCDGMWNMPAEFFSRENHPYKYGYGKLMHSGYHFIDLMCWFEELNADLVRKRADSAELYSAVVRPNDFLDVLNASDYRRLLGTSRFDWYFKPDRVGRLREFGELDYYGLVQFRRAERTLTTASLGLLQNGFSRRAWSELPVDTYKGNGRVRHERVNIQVGPLLNVQVHSYQAAEIRERERERERERDRFRNRHARDDVGSLEHFEVYIFRNVDLIGGEACQRLTMRDLVDPSGDAEFLGFNEQARQRSLSYFLSGGKEEVSDLSAHARSVKMLANAYLSLCRRSIGQPPTVRFDL